jgi:hypothetical protein
MGYPPEDIRDLEYSPFVNHRKIEVSFLQSWMESMTLQRSPWRDRGIEAVYSGLVLLLLLLIVVIICVLSSFQFLLLSFALEMNPSGTYRAILHWRRTPRLSLWP